MAKTTHNTEKNHKFNAFVTPAEIDAMTKPQLEQLKKNLSSRLCNMRTGRTKPQNVELITAIYQQAQTVWAEKFGGSHQTQTVNEDLLKEYGIEK